MMTAARMVAISSARALALIFEGDASSIFFMMGSEELQQSGMVKQNVRSGWQRRAIGGACKQYFARNSCLFNFARLECWFRR